MPSQRNENSVYTRNRGFSYRSDFLGGTRVILEGWADPGTAEDSEKWQIVRYTYTNNKLTKSEWAQKTLTDGITKQATDEFLFAWDNRNTSITYS